MLRLALEICGQFADHFALNEFQSARDKERRDDRPWVDLQHVGHMTTAALGDRHQLPASSDLCEVTFEELPIKPFGLGAQVVECAIVGPSHEKVRLELAFNPQAVAHALRYFVSLFVVGNSSGFAVVWP